MSATAYELATMPYRDYLKTDHWATKRKEALDRANNRCTLCNDDTALQVHHRTYERRGCERSDDLIVLCAACHERFHDVIDGKAQRTVKTMHKPQCPDGIYLFKLDDVYLSGTFPDGNDRVLWRFEIVQAEAIQNEAYVGRSFVAHTGHTMKPGSAMRRWTEALLDRFLRDERITSDRLLGRHMFAGIVDGRINAAWSLFPSNGQAMVPPFQSGDMVRHARFGTGVVTRLLASGDDWRVDVCFLTPDIKGRRDKQLMYSLSGLELVTEADAS